MSSLASTYAQALYDLAKEESLQTEMLEQLNQLSEIFWEEKDYLRLLSAPNVGKDARCQLVKESLEGRVHPYVLNFLQILIRRDAIRSFPDCCKAFSHLYDEEYGILPVEAVTAVALRPEQTRRLTEKLAALTGKTIRLTNRVDRDCIGGVRLKYDGKMVDGTVAGKLKAVRELLTTADASFGV